MRTHHFLQDDSHFLLVDDVRRGSHVVLAGTIEHGSIDALDGIAQHAEAHILVLRKGNHVSAVDARERLVVGVFEQGRGTDGDRLAHHFEERHEVFSQAFWQTGMEEIMEDVGVGNVAQRHLVELVALHELIENVGTEHDSLRNHHLGIRETVEFGMALDDVVDEGNATSLASERTVADAGKVGIAVEAVAVEHCHHTLVLHATVSNNGIEDDLAVLVHVLQRIPCDVFQEFGDREQGTRPQPARHVVATDVVEERLSRHGEDVVLQVLEVSDASHLLHGDRVAENEIAETEIALHQFAQIHVHLLRVLVDERCLALLSPFSTLRLGAFQNQRHELVLPADGRKEVETSPFVLHPVAGKTTVADDTQHVVLVFRVERPSLLVVPCQHNLRTASHAERFELRIERLGSKEKTLLQNKLVEVGKNRRIEADGVLHEHNHLHAARNVVLQVHFVLYEFDDRQEQVCVAQPAEHIFEDAQVLMLHALRDAMTERREHHNRDVRVVHLDVASNVEHIVVVRAWHTNHQFEARLPQLLLSLLLRSNLEEARRIAKPQLGVFLKNLLIHAAVVLKNEGIVGIGNEQHIEDAPLHHVNKRGVVEHERTFLRALVLRLSLLGVNAIHRIVNILVLHTVCWFLSVDVIPCKLTKKDGHRHNKSKRKST